MSRDTDAKRLAIAEALTDAFAPSNQVPMWKTTSEKLRERATEYAKDFEKYLAELGYRIESTSTTPK